MTQAASERRPQGRRRNRDDGPRASWRQLWPYLAERRAPVITAAVLSVLGALATLALPLLAGRIITAAQQSDAPWSLIWALLALLFASAVITGVQYYLLARTGEGIVASARTRLVRHILRLPIAEYDRRRTGDLVSRVASDTTLLRAVLTRGLVDAVGGVFTLAGALVGMLLIDPLLLSLTALVVVAAVAAVGAMSGQVRRATRAAQDAVGDLSASVERAVASARTIRAAGAAERETNEVVSHAQRAWRSGIRIAGLSSAVGPMVQVSLEVAMLVVLGVGGMRVASGTLPIGELVSFVLFLFLMMVPLVQAAGAFTSVQGALGALGRIQEILDVPVEDAVDRVPSDEPASRSAEVLAPTNAHSMPSIEFCDVGFRYAPDLARRSSSAGSAATPDPSQEPLVLDGLSFTVAPGTKTALVGPSGAGKSTALALVERFYDACNGSVIVEGRDVRDWSRDRLRARIGYVEQDAPTLAGSIRDNLMLASPDATDHACLDVLRRVNLTHLVERSEAGLDTQVGEQGVMLSGGERQRLAIARTLLSGRPIMLLDESTSSLDGLNERLLKDAIAEAGRGRAMLVVAHRLSTVVDADQIVVMERGRAVASGTHAELLQASPLYRALAHEQLLDA